MLKKRVVISKLFLFLTLSLFLSESFSVIKAVSCFDTTGFGIREIMVDKVVPSLCSTDSKIDQLELCAAIPIITDSPLISTSGSYCLTQNITGSLTITTDDVVIDLNNNLIDGSLSTGIFIDDNLHNITIKNGTVRGTTEQGIFVSEGCRKILLEDLTVCDCALVSSLPPAFTASGIVFLGLVTNQIQDCILSNVTVINCASGVLFENVNSIRTLDCTVLSCANDMRCAGFLILGGLTPPFIPSKNMLFENCFVSNLTADGECFGIFGASMENILFEDCVVNQCLGAVTIGIGAQRSECISIINCSACEIEVSAQLGPLGGASGYLFSNCEHLYFDHCMTQSLSAPLDITGFNFEGLSHAIFKNCGAENIIANQQELMDDGSAVGFSAKATLENPIVQDITFDHCYVRNLQALGTRGGSTGFLIEGCSNVYYTDCSVMELQSVHNLANTLGFSCAQGEDITINKSLVQNLVGANLSGFTVDEFTRVHMNGNSSSSLLNNDASGVARGFNLNTVTGGNICNCNSSFNHAVHISALDGIGFRINDSSEISFDLCKTTSNFSGNPTNNDGIGFTIAESTNIILDGCTSSYNSDDAFSLDSTTTRCLVSNCTASLSERGFVDLSTTNTFYNNVASKNTTANYVNVPFVVTQGAATIAGGNLSA